MRYDNCRNPFSGRRLCWNPSIPVHQLLSAHACRYGAADVRVLSTNTQWLRLTHRHSPVYFPGGQVKKPAPQCVFRHMSFPPGVSLLPVTTQTDLAQRHAHCSTGTRRCCKGPLLNLSLNGEWLAKTFTDRYIQASNHAALCKWTMRHQQKTQFESDNRPKPHGVKKE